MLADTKRELSQALGVLHGQEGVPLRARFIVDPTGILRHVSVNDLSVGRNAMVEDAVAAAALMGMNSPRSEPCGRGEKPIDERGNLRGGATCGGPESLARAGRQ